MLWVGATLIVGAAAGGVAWVCTLAAEEDLILWGSSSAISACGSTRGKWPKTNRTKPTTHPTNNSNKKL